MLTHIAHEPKLIEIAAQGEEDGIKVRMSQGLAESTLDIWGLLSRHYCFTGGG